MNALRQQAIRLLARREYTRAELRKKLGDEGSTEEIDAVLADLVSRGLLSDERAIASYLRGHGARFGAARLRQTLRDKGVEDDAIAAGMAEIELPDELDRARTIWQRKFQNPPQDQREWARQARFLQLRGFEVDVIRRLLKVQKEQEEA